MKANISKQSNIMRAVANAEYIPCFARGLISAHANGKAARKHTP